MTPARIRVAAIPAAHPYVRAICDPEQVQLLADPPPFPGAPETQWWPPRMLDATWICAHAADFDVLHLHFGGESYSPDHVAAALAEAAAVGRPVVFTVHDLENPQLHDQSEHRRMLDLVVPAADEVIALTASSQHEIQRRWGRLCHLMPHPALATTFPTGRARAGCTVGVHLRDLRPNIDATGTVATLVRAVAMLRSAGADLHGVVHVNERVRDEQTAGLVEQMLAGNEGVRLHRVPRMTDDELAAALADLDACVLPYSHGTHSGWVELCHDLGVPVIGPRVGHFASQHPDDYTAFDIGDPVSLAAAIQLATDAAAARPGSAARAATVTARASRRSAQSAQLQAAHTRLYRQALDRTLAA